MRIRKSGLVSNNYGNYFNIVKQKDRAIYLFEMLTVSFDFHSVVSVCVRVEYFSKEKDGVVLPRCVLSQSFCLVVLFFFFFLIESNTSTCLRRGGHDPEAPTLK